MQTKGTTAHFFSFPSTISIELCVPGTVLKGNNDTLALRNNLESVLSGFPIANAMWGRGLGGRQGITQLSSAKAKGNSVN